MTVHRVACRLAEGETLKDRPRKGRSRVVKTRTRIKKALENNPTLKMTHLAKKGISVSTVRRAVKIEGGKSLKMVRKPLLTFGIKLKSL